MPINVRTDLASEARRIAQGDAGEMTALHGVEAHEETLHGFGVTAVEILDDNGAQKLNKPIGKYFSLELPSFMDRGGENFAGAAEAISELLRRCLPLRTRAAAHRLGARNTFQPYHTCFMAIIITADSQKVKRRK